MTCCTNGFAQNNPIFGGGNSDGWDRSLFNQGANDIFNGGAADGWHFSSFSQAGANIFAGGEGDGWHRGIFAQTGNTIFNGGEGDGWNFTTYLQAGNAIFNGGEADGWHFTTYLQAGNDIYNGGQGDGWSSTYRPMGPLPVKYLYFNASKLNETAALLRWETSSEQNSATFDVERSADALMFEKIGSLAAAGNSATAKAYSFTDNQALNGLNYYRLKQVDKDGGFSYSPARVVRFGLGSQSAIKYFPNPTTSTLNVQWTEELVKEAKLINISNAAGVVINQWKQPANGQNSLRVDMSHYPKGIYFIQVRTTNSNSVQRIVLQ